tara:strand:- start:155 stop:694 length:540 start_codon:yes stop_codon:yes gene_type:complete
MGKRSDFPRRNNDFYPTPEQAVLPLLDELRPETVFDEPCAGDGSLVRHLEKHGHHCLKASDIEVVIPRSYVRGGVDALEIQHSDAMFFITNPPWTRPILHDMILHLSALRPAWLLIDAGWIHTKQSAPYMEFCLKIISIGRVKWIEGSKHTGKDDCVWALFDRRYESIPHPTLFKGRSS